MKKENTTPTNDTKRYVPYGINGMYYIYDNQEHYCLPGQSGSNSRRMIKRKCEQLNHEESQPPTPTKEGLHTQGEWKVGKKYTSRFKEYLPILCAEPSFAATIAVVHPINNKLKEEDYANAELIVKAVNERQALLDSHRELLDALTNATERMERARGILNRNSESNWGMLDTSDLQTAINNAKNIKQ